MRKLALLCSVFFGISAQAANLNDYSGTFISRATDPIQEVQLDSSNGSIFLNFISGWHNTIEGSTYEFECHRNRCFTDLPELQANCSVELVLLSSGNVLFATTNPSACTGRVLLEPKSGQTPSKERWEVSQTVDRSGVLKVMAAISSPADNARLEMSCQAPIDKLSMTLEIEDILWRAIAFSVKTQGETLAARVEVNGVSYQLDHWNLSTEGLLKRVGSLTDEEIHDFRAGNRAHVTLMTIDSQGAVTELTELSFSLKGSARAFEESQNRCLGESTHSPSLFLEAK